MSRLLRHTRVFDLLLEVGDLVRRIFHLAEFFLNRLHLLIQVVLALTLLHLLLDATANALLDLQHVDFGVDQAHDVLEPLTHALDLQNLLFLIEFQRHVRGDGIGQTTRLIDARTTTSGFPAAPSCSV